MELKIPPPLLFICATALIYALPDLFPKLMWLQFLAILLAFIGLCLDLASLWVFLRHKTTISPFTPNNTRTLVITGIYRFSRNPMYLSFVCYLAAFSLWLANPFAVVVIAVFVAYLTHFQIVPEERILQAKFGQTYRDYQAKVRRWL